MLYSKKERYDEHRQFIEWLLDAIRENKVDVLVIAGDIFDTASPSNTSLKMYYNFLVDVRNSGCSCVIVTGGNHDSAGVLEAPKEILSAIDVKVVGRACENINDEVFVINKQGAPIAIICAVPFLRERDISRYTEGETYASRSARIAECVSKHYADVAEIAERKRVELNADIPIIATGHLSIAGGRRIENDGVRETYIGTIEFLSADIFSPIFDYVALGHFHIASSIADNIRYCGSPIAMGFGEVLQSKSVEIIDFEAKTICQLPIPVFQKMESICGNSSDISSRIAELRANGESVWVEIVYDGNELLPDLTKWINEQVRDTNIDVLKSSTRRDIDSLADANIEKKLDELNETEVFDILLRKKDVPSEQHEELKEMYMEIIYSINNENIDENE
jgi:exonuclease SbcD